MSANNGNRSRFHVDRKRRIARKMQMRELAKALATKSAEGATDSSPKKSDTGTTPGAK
jgi:hypothetical protein